MIEKFNNWLFESQNEAIKDFDVFVENFEGETAEEEWKEYKKTIDDDLDGMYPAVADQLKNSLDNIYSFDPDLEPLFAIGGFHDEELVRKYSIFAGLFAPDGDYKGKKIWGNTATIWLIYCDSFESHMLGKISLPYCVCMEDRGMTRVYISKRDFINKFGSIDDFLHQNRGRLSSKKFGL